MRNRRNKPNRNKKNRGPQNSFKPKAEVVKAIEYEEGLSVGELATLLNRNSSDLIKILFMLGKAVTINTTLDDESVELICVEYDVEATKKEVVDLTSLEDDVEDDPKDLVERAPIVTIMGHVDHGKTTLLDTIRKTKVVEGEHGGITQHIGAYQVSVNGRKVTFLDTPGHEAFTAMRARGAKTTDVVIVVVAADDGVMPQTREAIDHARAANVPLIIAINKIDKPVTDFDRIYGELADLGVMTEEWGGDVPFCKISAKQGVGIKELLETVLLVSEMEELKANPKKPGTGTVIEAKLDKGRGPVATLLVSNGTVRAGDMLVVGASIGRVRKMVDDRGREIKEALPSTPIEIIGLNDVPEAGDLFKVFNNEKQARVIADKRVQAKVEAERKNTSAMSLEDLSKQIQEGTVQEIPVILKADVQGSAEAVKASLERIDVETVRVNVIRSTVGAISESDIMLASAGNAIIIGFNIRPTAAIRKKAEEEGVTIRLYNIIYKAVEEMEGVMKGLLAPVFEEIIYGQAEVRQTYKVSKVGTIAGCMVTDGKMVKEASVRLIRDSIVVYDGKMASLKRFQNDAKEVTTGYECGITIENFNDVKEGDIIEAYGEQEVPVE